MRYGMKKRVFSVKQTEHSSIVNFALVDMLKYPM